MTLIVAVGCTSRVPTSWESEYAKPNFMDQCKDGSPEPFCGCVWDEMVKTVDWDVYTKFDKQQAEAKSSKDIPALPSGIEKAVEKCSKRYSESESGTTTTEKSSTATTEADEATSTTKKSG